MPPKDRKAYSAKYYIENKERIDRRNRKWERAHPEVKRAAQLLRLYGITPVQFQRMTADQDGKCAICQKDFDQKKHGGAHVDHDHVTGAVRGLLCGPCNRWLGRYERPEFVEAVNRYLYRIRLQLVGNL